MLHRISRLLVGMSGVLGTVLLGIYFGVGFAVGLAQLPSNATLEQVVTVALRYHNVWLLGAWLQATGSLLSVIFFLGLVHESKAIAKLSGMLALIGAATLVSVVLVEGVVTIDLAQAALNGHQIASLTSFDLMTAFMHIYPVVPAPLLFLALGSAIWRVHVLPHIFAVAAVVIGGLFLLSGLVSLFVLPWLVLVAVGLQIIWVLAAGLVFAFYGHSTEYKGKII